MSPDVKYMETKKWFTIAANDIKAAELLLPDSDMVDIVAHHCQQSIEKSMKGFLFFHGMRYSKTHDLNTLSQECISIDQTLSSLLALTAPLNQYAVDYRYPGQTVHPVRDELEEMIVLAKKCYQQLLSRLPAEIIGSMRSLS